MSKLEYLRERVLERLSGCQCKAEMPYDSYRLAEIEGELRALKWTLCMIDILMKEASDEIQTHTALRP